MRARLGKSAAAPVDRDRRPIWSRHRGGCRSYFGRSWDGFFRHSDVLRQSGRLGLRRLDVSTSGPWIRGQSARPC